MRRFAPAELQQYLNNTDEKPVLLDVREPWEFERCHLPNSLLIPMRNVPAAIAQQELSATQAIVVICHHGIRSRQIGLYLEQQGFVNVINLEGGVEAWAQDVEPTMPRY